MQVVVPDILIAGRPIVLAGGDAFAAKCDPHGLRKAARRAKEFGAETLRNVEHVLVVTPGNHQTIASDAGVMVSRNQSEDVLIHQHHS